MAILLPPLTSQSSSTPPPTTAVPGGPVDKNMFMKLLVAQLRHQDPMKPTDGMQFVAELAQFQQLEQTINGNTDIAAIRADLDLLAHPESES
jgi:flagellar basal-body rod modification protein FlgD